MRPVPVLLVLCPLWSPVWSFWVCPPAAASPQGAGPGAATPAALCRVAIGTAERAAGLPERLMVAIGLVESGRRDPAGGVSPWPWTINAEGIGRFFATKAEAIEAAQALLDRGVRSLDVGCMQVNLLHHPAAFASLDQAFDPAANARYAARFLTALYAQTGAWPRAVAGYHSLTPEIGEAYARKVLAVWPRERGLDAARAEAEMARALAGMGTRNGALPPGPATVALAGGAVARVMVLPDTLSGRPPCRPSAWTPFGVQPVQGIACGDGGGSGRVAVQLPPAGRS